METVNIATLFVISLAAGFALALLIRMISAVIAHFWLLITGGRFTND